MPAFFLTFLSMLSGSLGPIGEWIKRKQEMQMLQQETDRQIAMQQLKMATEGIKADGVAANTRLKSTGRYFKYVTFVMWFIPFVTCLVSPTASSAIFNNFNQMPDWYSKSCVLMMFAVWGISVSAPVVNSIFSSLGNYIADGRAHKETLAKLNRPEFYNSLRAQKGALSEQEVAQIEKALDASDD